MRFSFTILFLLSAILFSSRLFAEETGADFFEKSVRPLLVRRCLKCHSGEKKSGGLRLDLRSGLLEGGESGAAVVSGKAGQSLLIEAVRREGGLEMPPDETLSKAEVRVLERWIELGVPWPKSTILKPEQTAKKAKTHWAFQPVGSPRVPSLKDPWLQAPVDAFVLRKLHQRGLSPSPEADRRTLIRRLSYTLTGLPPVANEVAAFENDSAPWAEERLVDRLLESPHYGEHWGRQWLDLARYADTKGYVYAREERFWVHAWAYRDWVVKALNEDLPYNRFLLLQLAGDQVEDRRPGDLAAMGFLTLGRRFLGVTHDIIDDRIDVVCRGTMALTVGCARCHDHKYDPIPTADYYSLYGVFDSSAEKMVSLSEQPMGDEGYRKELAARQQKLAEQMADARLETGNRIRQRIADYLQSQTELEKYPSQGFDQIFQKSDMLPAFVRQWAAYLRKAKREHDPRFRHWHAYLEIPQAEFSSRAAEVARQLGQLKEKAANRLVAEAFQEPPASFAEVIARYAKLFREADRQWKSLIEEAKQTGKAVPCKLPDADWEALRRVLYGSFAPCEVPDEPIVHTETYFDSATCTALWKLQGEVDRWMIRSKAEVPYALTLVDRPLPHEPRIFRRGDPAKMGADVPRHFLSLFSDGKPKPFQHGSGRWELANAIVNPANPLTARVIVNRVWAKHFGQGLVPTTSDFGLRADPPSHPELLDWLTRNFIEDGWSLKKLHRRILLSATYRQSSLGPNDPAVKAKAIEIDPANKFLWRMNSHRLSFEEFRDSLLADAGQLNPQLGGKPVELLKPPFSNRRTLYGLMDRQFFPSTLRVFDVANPDLHIAERSETTVPQQSLFFMNHPLVLARARELAGRVRQPEPTAAVRTLFQAVLEREPTLEELADALAFLKQTEPPPLLAAGDWQYGYGFYDEEKHRVAGFQKLLSIKGKAGQDGPSWPDAKLGWEQLTADGGHPGSDLKHAAIRRWTVPRDMSIQIRSKLSRKSARCDGIRAIIIGSAVGEVKSATISQKSSEFNVDALPLKAGETIDFLVTIPKDVNSDEYQWTATLKEIGTDSPALWNFQTDYHKKPSPELTPRQQLAQVLFCSNEFLFVD